jgi:hypothetical protein
MAKDVFKESQKYVFDQLNKSLTPEIATAIARPDLIAFMGNRFIETTDREGNDMLILKPLPSYKRKKHG